MLYHNFKLLCEKAKEYQNSVLKKLGFSQSSPYHWRDRKTANTATLLRLSEYFSKKLNIPLDLFENGQALLTRDFSQILAEKERSLQLERSDLNNRLDSAKNVSTSSTENKSPDQNYSVEEKELLNLIRRYDSGNPNIRISPTALEILRDFIVATRLDLDYLKHQASAIRSYGHAYGSNKGGEDISSEDEETKKE